MGKGADSRSSCPGLCGQAPSVPELDVSIKRVGRPARAQGRAEVPGTHSTGLTRCEHSRCYLWWLPPPPRHAAGETRGARGKDPAGAAGAPPGTPSPLLPGPPQPAGPPPLWFIVHGCRRDETEKGVTSSPSHRCRQLKLETCIPGWPPSHPVLPDRSPRGPFSGRCSPFPPPACDLTPRPPRRTPSISCLPSPPASRLLAMACGPLPRQNCPLLRPQPFRHPTLRRGWAVTCPPFKALSLPSPTEGLSAHTGRGVLGSCCQPNSLIEPADCVLEAERSVVEDVG